MCLFIHFFDFGSIGCSMKQFKSNMCEFKQNINGLILFILLSTHVLPSCLIMFQAMVETAIQRDGNNLVIADRRYALDRNVHIVAFGKAVIGMVKTAEEILHDQVVSGIASIPWGIQDVFKHLGKW